MLLYRVLLLFITYLILYFLVGSFVHEPVQRSSKTFLEILEGYDGTWTLIEFCKNVVLSYGRKLFREDRPSLMTRVTN